MHCLKRGVNLLSSPVIAIHKVPIPNKNAINLSKYNVSFSSFKHSNLHNLKFELKNFPSAGFQSRNLNLKDSLPRIVLHRSFKTSEPRKVHPFVIVVFKSLLKLAAALSGRGFRKWWRALPKDKKRYFLGVLISNKKKISAFVLVFILSSLGFYISHIEETPITKRKRFMALNLKKMTHIFEVQKEETLKDFGSQIIPANHPATLRVQNIVNTILKANQDIEEVHDKQWGVSIIHDETENAFVLPLGHVFVCTGMLKLCTNNDQLAGIIAHEMAHCLQNHTAENIGFGHLLDGISVFIIAAIWALLPSDIISFITHWLYHKLIKIFLKLPYSRKLETEADYVGMQLAAKACYDVREYSAFWSKMAILKKTFDIDQQVEFLSTHPSHEKRSEYLDSIMNKAISLRSECGCPDLKLRDPRLDIDGVSKALEMARRQLLKHKPKPETFY